MVLNNQFCYACAKTYSSVNFKNHLMSPGHIKHGIPDDDILHKQCELCDHRYTNKYEELRHFEKAHQEEFNNTVTCDCCGVTMMLLFYIKHVNYCVPREEILKERKAKYSEYRSKYYKDNKEKYNQIKKEKYRQSKLQNTV